MQIHIITLGKNKDKALQAMIEDYLKRMAWTVVFKEIVPPQCSDAERKSREAELIRAALPAKAFVIALDERGDMLDSPGFAARGDTLQQTHSTVAFVIGGADGLDEALRRQAQMVVCFGRMTWPHMLVRLMLVEQLYRASTILAGHPYHRV